MNTVFMIVVLQYALKLERMIPLASLFFLNIVLASQGLLCFHMNFRFILSSSIKNDIAILIGITFFCKLPWVV